MTFDAIFKAWSAQITEHVKEIKSDLKAAEAEISKKSTDCQAKVSDLDIRVQALREEFVIFKAEQNTRIKIISAIVGISVLLSTLIINLDRIKDVFTKNKNIPNTESIK